MKVGATAVWSRVVRVGVVLGFALAAALASGAAAAPTGTKYYDWTGYQGSSLHEGLTPGRGLSVHATLKWRAYSGNGAFNNPPIIAGGTIFAAVGGQIAPIVHAYDIATGAELWTYTFQTNEVETDAQLAYESGRLFAVATNGTRVALDAKTGQVIWNVSMRGQNMKSPVTADRGMLYLLQGTTPFSNTETSLLAISQADGAVKYKRFLGNGYWGAPAVHASSVFVDAGNETVYLFSTTLQQKWVRRTKITTERGAPPVLHDGKIYARDYGVRPVVLSASSGKVLGRVDSDATPAFSGTTMVVINDGRMAGVSTVNGRTLWQAPKEDPGLTCTSAPVIASSAAYCARADGTIRGDHMKTGKQVWISDGNGDQFLPIGAYRTLDSRLAIGDGVLVSVNVNQLSVFG